MTITYDQQTIGIISTFEKLTKTTVKNCVINSKSVLFIVKEGDAGKAIGKKGFNIQKLSNMLKKPVRVVEHSADPVVFVQNLIKNTNSKVYKADDGTIIIEPSSGRDKGIVLGRDRSHLNHLQELVSQHHKVKIKVQ